MDIEQQFELGDLLLQERRCRVCNEIKPLDEFPNDSSKRVFYGKKSYCKCCGMEKYSKPYIPENAKSIFVVYVVP